MSDGKLKIAVGSVMAEERKLKEPWKSFEHLGMHVMKKMQIDDLRSAAEVRGLSKHGSRAMLSKRIDVWQNDEEALNKARIVVSRFLAIGVKLEDCDRASHLALDIKYDITSMPQRFYIATNVKHHLVHDLIGEFVHSQVGAGEDTRKAAGLLVYVIRIRVDLGDDNFEVQSDTNNNGLREGILILLMTVLKKTPERVEWVEDIDEVTTEFERRSGSEGKE